MQRIDDESHLQYICENSPYRQRIFCRRGKLLPRKPVCYNGKIYLKSIENHQNNLFLGCYVNNENIIFSKTFYYHREKVYYTCTNNTLPLSTNEVISCINGKLSKQPICHSSKFPIEITQ